MLEQVVFSSSKDGQIVKKKVKEDIKFLEELSSFTKKMKMK